MDSPGPAEEIDHISEIDREKQSIFEIMFVNGPSVSHMLMGFENALCALLTDHKEAEESSTLIWNGRSKLMEKSSNITNRMF